jgi:hypothetical protein
MAPKEHIMDREKRIVRAINYYRNGICKTITEAANKWDIPRKTLSQRLDKHHVSRQEGQVNNMRLNPAQEKAVVRWIQNLTRKGWPPSYSYLRGRVWDLIKREYHEARPLGKNYCQGFLRRHKDLGAAFANRVDKKRVVKHARQVYQDHFTKVRSNIMFEEQEWLTLFSGKRLLKNINLSLKTYIIWMKRVS